MLMQRKWTSGLWSTPWVCCESTGCYGASVTITVSASADGAVVAFVDIHAAPAAASVSLTLEFYTPLKWALWLCPAQALLRLPGLVKGPIDVDLPFRFNTAHKFVLYNMLL